MVLLGEEVLAQGVEGEELAGQDTGVNEALSYKHDLSNKFKIGDDHGTRPVWWDMTGVKVHTTLHVIYTVEVDYNNMTFLGAKREQ